MKPRTKQVAKNLALAVGSVVLVVAVLELLARLMRRTDWGGKELGVVDLYTAPDPLLGWRLSPQGRATYRRREYTVEVVINSLGLRDREREYRAAPGAFRILALGDSFIEGYSVPFEATVSQVLERALAGPGCPVEVVNGGVRGYSTDQQYLFYKTEGARYSPHVVALFFYFNDIVANAQDNYFGSAKPLLSLGQDGRLEPVNVPIPPPPPPASPVPLPRPPGPPSVLAELVRERLRMGAPRTYNALARLGLWAPIQVRQPPLHFKAFKRHRVPEIEEGWAATASILTALAQEVEAAGSRLVVVYIPSRMEVDRRSWELTSLGYGFDDRRWSPTHVVERLAEVTTVARVPLLDLTAPLRAAHGWFSGPYYVYDGHWNAVGHQVAAGELVSFLRARGWLPDCAGSV